MDINPQPLPPIDAQPAYRPAYAPGYPAYPGYNCIEGPARVFGIIFLVFGVLNVIGLFVLLVLAFLPERFAHDGQPHARMILFGLISIVVFVSMVLHLAAGYGLLARKPWGRTAAIVLSIFALLSIPIGTVIGGIALYFFLRQGAAEDYARLTAPPLT